MIGSVTRPPKRRRAAIVEAAARPAAKPSLAASIGWSLGGTVVYNACQWGTVVACARLGNEAMVGQFARGMAITTPIVLLANCALRTVQATDVRDQFHFSDYLLFRAIALTLASVAILAIVGSIHLDLEAACVVVAIAAMKILESLSDLLQGLMQRHERLDWINQSQMLRGAGALLAFATGLITTHSLTLASVATVGVYLVTLVAFDVPRFRRLIQPAGAQEAQAACLSADDLRHRRSRLWQLAYLALPMGATVASASLLFYLPRYFIDRYLGTDALGVYSALAWLTLGGSLVATALNHAALPRMSQQFASGDYAAFRRLAIGLLASMTVVGLLASGAVLLVRTPLISLIYGEAYVPSFGTLALLMLSMLFAMQVCCLDHSLYAARWFAIQAPLNVVTVAFAVAAGWWFVPSGGLAGAALVACLAMGLQAALRLPLLYLVLRHLRQAAQSTAEEPGWGFAG